MQSKNAPEFDGQGYTNRYNLLAIFWNSPKDMENEIIELKRICFVKHDSG